MSTMEDAQRQERAGEKKCGNVKPAPRRLTHDGLTFAPRGQRAMRAIAIAVMQTMLLPTMGLWHVRAIAQESPDSGDGLEGSASCETPNEQKNSDAADDEDAPDEDPADDEDPLQDDASPGPEGGDAGGGDAAPGDVAGTDADGGDASTGTEDDFSNSLDGGGSDGFGSTHDPIDLRLADKRHVQVDYLGVGAGALRLARVYHSNLAAFPAQVTIPMGVGWRSHYDRTLQVISSTQVRLHRANGRTLDFSLSGGNWVSTVPAGTLSQITGGWKYVNHRNGIEQYGSNGKLQSLTRNGLASSLQYDTAGRLTRVSNPFGRSLAFAYDGAGRLSTATLPGAGTLTYGYDTSNNLTSIRFADGSVRQYVYENASFRNALTGVVDESGRRRLTWGYDAAGRPNDGYYGSGVNRVRITYNGSTVTSTDARGTVRTRTYTTVAGRTLLSSIQTAATSDSPATGWSFGYDSAGNVTRVTSRSGEVRQFAQDARARATNITRASGTAQAVSMQATWHPVFRKRTQTVAQGITRNVTLDASGRTTAITQIGTDGTSSTVLSKVFNAQGLLQSVTDARGGVTTHTYDSLGNRTSTTNPQGQTTYFSGHTAHGQPTTVQRPDGTVISRTFDARGRLASRTVAGATTSYAYDAAGRLSQVTKPDGSWRRRTYDAAGYLASLANHRGETITIGRDAAGNEVSRTIYAANGTVAQAASQQFNGHGRLAATLDSRSQRTLWLYGADGRPSGMTNPLGQTLSTQRDVFSRVVSTTQPNTTAMRNLGGPATVSTSNGYHATLPRLQSTTDTVTVATGFAYDRFNRRVAESGADAGNRAWVRNAAGDTTSVTDARGVTFTITRDSLGRVTSVTPAGGATTTITYVTGRSDNLPASVADPSGTTRWTYDSMGRVLSKSQTVAGLTRTLTLTRDAMGRVTRMVYPSGVAMDYAYSGDVVSSVTAGGYPLISGITYRPFSQVPTGWNWGNGSRHNRVFDADGRLTQVTLGSTTRSYAFDALGRITGFTDVGTAGSKVSTIGYDEAGQVVSYSGPQGNYTYGYDTNGNRRSVTVNGSTAWNTYATGTNRILSSPNGTYAYNVDGNPTSDGYYNFGYDAYGRLSVLSAVDYKVERRYNALGQRVSSIASQYSGGVIQAAPVAPGSAKAPAMMAPTHAAAQKSAGTKGVAAAAATSGWSVLTSTQFFYDDDGRLIGEYPVSPNGVAQETLWFNGLPVAALIGGVGYMVHADHLATPRALVRISDGVEAWRWDSEPFGSSWATGLPGVVYNLRFPGQQYDADTGYHYNWMRDYNSWTGRYLQSDPIGLAGGLSRYSYVEGNPMNGIDPLGLWSFTIGFFPGTGGQLTIGRNPNGSGFMSGQFGFGIGGGFSFNAAGTSPGYQACQCGAWTLGYGLFGEAGVQGGPAKLAVEGKFGRNVNSCGSTSYGGISGKSTFKDGIALKGSMAAGGQLTIAGGGSAPRECTCGS